jgi:hypothetical protein
MENPLTWSPLHHELHEACYHSSNAVLAVLKVLQIHGHNVTAEQVQKVFDEHQRDMDDHVCGLSLPSMLVNQLGK